MANKSISMSKIRQILRLHSQGSSNLAIYRLMLWSLLSLTVTVVVESKFCENTNPVTKQNKVDKISVLIV